MVANHSHLILRFAPEKYPAKIRHFFAGTGSGFAKIAEFVRFRYSPSLLN